MATTALGEEHRASGPNRPSPPEARRSSSGRLDALLQRLCAPIDIASLAVFRVLFGAIMLWEVARFFYHGWIRPYYVDPAFHFTYFLFDWVQPWPGNWMYLHFWVLGVLAISIMAGAMYRISTTLFFLGISYVFLLDQATYLNHMYLVCVVSFLMIFVPCHRAYSVDAWNWPGWRASVAPTWALWVLRFQIAVPYTYGGIAKLNLDWLQGEPVRMWLAGRASRSAVPWLLTSEWTVYVVSYGGLLFDLFIVPLLLWRRTRVPAFLVALFFHLSNWYLFNIGIFPWFMIAGTLLFFAPSWPREALARVWSFGRALVPRRAAPSLATLQIAPSIPLPAPRRPGRLETAVLGLLALHVAFQLLFPFRHWLYPGDVAWNEEGHRFAWRMKLRDKSHTVTYYAVVPGTSTFWQLQPREFVRRWQESEMDGRPDMVLQLVHYMKQRLAEQGYPDVQIYVRALTSLNGRQRADLIDPTVDLTTKQRTFWPADWLLPLHEPLRPTRREPQPDAPEQPTIVQPSGAGQPVILQPVASPEVTTSTDDDAPPTPDQEAPPAP